MVEMCLSVLPTYFTPYGNLSLVKKRDANLNVFKTILILVLSLQNCLVNFFLFVNLQKKEYPPKLIDKLVNKYLNNKIMNKPSETEQSKIKENIKYFKLRFIGKFSKFTENELQKLTKQFCKGSTNTKIVFSTFKLTSLF